MQHSLQLLILSALFATTVMPATEITRTFLDTVFLRQFRYLRNLGLDIFGHTSKTQTSIGKASKFGRIQRQVSSEVQFPCLLDGMRSLTTPKSIHRLRPGDIDVIGALGDSLTAGNGIVASSILEVYTENRGLTWSIGGQGTWRQFFTLPNILKLYNPKLFGYSLGDSLSTQKDSQFNCAEIAAMSRDMPFMAKELVKRMRNDKRVNVKKHWKMVTILIGANDFAVDVCYNDLQKSAEKHRRDMIDTMRILRDNLPRTFVNLVLAPSFDILMKFKGVPEDCRMYHMMESPCFFGRQFEKIRPTLVNITKQWQEVDLQIETMPEFNDRDDFAVVVQPFIRKLIFPSKSDGNTDFSYMSADCYHFSQKGNALATNALWNNIMEPIGNKSENWDKEFQRFICPTEESPYIYTRKNSKNVKAKITKMNEFKRQRK